MWGNWGSRAKTNSVQTTHKQGNKIKLTFYILRIYVSHDSRTKEFLNSLQFRFHIYVPKHITFVSYSKGGCWHRPPPWWKAAGLILICDLLQQRDLQQVDLQRCIDLFRVKVKHRGRCNFSYDIFRGNHEICRFFLNLLSKKKKTWHVV